MDFFSPPSNQQQNQPYTEQLDWFSTSPPFSFNSGSLEGGQVELTGGAEMHAVPRFHLDPFIAGGGNQGEAIGMDMDDPILNSLQTLAEGGDFGGSLGESQNLNVWEWFEQQ
jgi:hypothetical protein